MGSGGETNGDGDRERKRERRPNQQHFDRFNPPPSFDTQFKFSLIQENFSNSAKPITPSSWLVISQCVSGLPR